MIRASHTASRTDTGRMRPENEDSFLVRVPLFVVADGMGGAQAGEVASKIAVDTFRTAMPHEGAPEQRLAETVKAANREIHALSREEEGRQGMGTTLTAALLDDDHLAVAHVGDSRAYLLRDGELQRLTEDHSLVAELVKRGKLTEAQAEEHPQRSIITRALGPEPEVEVDTWTFPVRGEDVILLCSDGLTAMLSEAQIAEILRRSPSLDDAASALIAAANAAGGRDNITVVLARMEELGSGAAGDAATMVRPPTAADPRDPRTAGDRASQDPAARGATEAGSAASVTMVLSETERQEILERVGSEPAPEPGRRRSPRRARGRLRQRFASPLAALTSSAVVLGLIVAGGYLASRQLFFIGTNGQGIVTIYRGLPYQLPLGLNLYETYYVSGVPAAIVPASRRARLFSHDLRSQADAQTVVRDLELGQISR